MLVRELIAKLSLYPVDSNVYIEDTDTRWIFGEFNVTRGSAEEDHGKPDAVFLWVASYGDREEEI